MNSEEITKKITQLKRKIENFISKYDSIYTLYYVSLQQRKSENPIVNFLFNLCLKDKNINKLKPSKSELNNLIKNLETYCFHQKNLVLFEQREKKKENIIVKAKLEYLKNLINPEMYIFQLYEKINSIFQSVEEDFFNEFYFYPIHIQVVFSFINDAMRSQKDTPLLFKEKDVLDFIDRKKNIFESKNKKGISYYLDSISSEFETNKEYQSIFNEDVSKKKPLIKINDQYFFCNFMQMLYFLPYQLEELINLKGSKSLKDKYRKSKQEYTEGLTYKNLKKIFGEKNVFRNLYYTHENEKYEIDTLVYYDYKVIVCETKSNKMRENSLAGNFKKLEKDLKNIIKKPFEQSERAINYISQNSKSSFYNKQGNLILEINNDSLLDFFSIGIHEANLMGIVNNINQSNLNYFKKQYFWAVNLLELDIILNHIKYPSLFIHYIKSRLEAQEGRKVFANDELSFFGLFLSDPCGGFYFNDNSTINVLLPDLIKPLDDFYTGQTNTCPEVKIDIRIKKFIEEREDLNIKEIAHRHTDVICALLRMNKSYLNNFFDNMDMCIQKTKKDKKTHNMFTPLADDINGFGFVSDIDTKKGMQVAKNLALKNKYQNKLDSVIYLFKNVNDDFFISNFLCYIFPFKQNSQMDKILLEYEKNNYPKLFKSILNKDGSITNKPVKST